MPHLTFPRPQFALLPDSKGPRWYANVDNQMEVCAGGETFHVAVAVPTGLFTFFKDVLQLPPEVDVSLALDEEGDDEHRRYVFSLFYGDNELRDLWSYSRGSLPAWILSEKYRL